MKLFPFLSLSLCRSGSLKARLCSTWSAASAWTVRPRRALWSSRSVAPRWPASPGSHKSSPEPQRTGGGRGRGRKREEQDLDPACRKTLGVGEGRGITSAHCLTPRRGVEGVRTVLLWCQLQALLLIASRWQERRRKRYEASSGAFCVQCFIPLGDAAVLLRNLSFSLKTVAHLTFSFSVSILVNDLLNHWSSEPRNNVERVHSVL